MRGLCWIAEEHVLVGHRDAPGWVGLGILWYNQWLGPWSVYHIGLLGEEGRKIPHIHQGLDDGVVHAPQEVEGREEVDHVRVHRHKLPEVHLPPADGVHGDGQPSHQSGVHYGTLHAVEQGQGGLHADAVVLVLLHRFAEALQLVLLVREVLHRLVVDDAVRCLVVELVVVLVGCLPELAPPQRDVHGQKAINDHTTKRQQGNSPHFEVQRKDNANSQALRQRRHQVEEEVGDEGVGGLRAAVHAADDVPHLLLQVPLQAQVVQVRKCALGDLHVGLLLHLEVDDALSLLQPFAGQSQ
mmetsp:Transcript_16161/g.23733  ORF Transcript_16161/g.23733 Transcript_16161/m.23733 type:complete len:298 (-) Transcript_16161:368-1261(-)